MKASECKCCVCGKQAKRCEEIFGVPAVILMMMYDIKKLEEERK